MRRIEYNKLVRDDIPAIIEQAGKDYALAELAPEEYRLALAQRLQEEAEEAGRSALVGRTELLKELADLAEVSAALARAFDITEGESTAIREERAETRGRFEKRLKLLWVEEPVQ